MGILRHKFLKGSFGILLLSILLLKFCAFSISAFSSSANAYSIEKSSEDNKDKEEESFDKAKKKLLHHESLVIVYEHPEGTKNLPLHALFYRLRIGAFPTRNVPTPPPDILL